MTELPLASEQQVAESTLGNAVIQWLVEQWTESTLVPSTEFNEFVLKHTRETAPLRDRPALPIEVIELIFGYIDEHVTYCALIGLNKEYRAIYNSNEAWKTLAHKCWTAEQLSFSKLVKAGQTAGQQSKKEKRKNEPRDRGPWWRQVFEEIYRQALQHSFVVCRHCNYFHDSVAHGRERRDEAYWDHCPCPDCDAGSWKSCDHADEYEWVD